MKTPDFETRQSAWQYFGMHRSRTPRPPYTMKTPDLDQDLPALVPEIIADTITQDPASARRLCERARHHWKTNAGFRKSFKRKDERSVLAMWMRHWYDGEKSRARLQQTN